MAFLGLEYVYPSAPPVLEDRALRTESLTFQTRIIERPGYRWRLQINLRPAIAHSAEARAVAAHQTRHGYHSPFVVLFPQLTGIARGNTNLTATAPKGATSIMVAHGIPTGRYVGILGRVHIVSTGRTNGGAVSIYPPLARQAQNTAAVNVNPTISVYYDDEFPLARPPDSRGTVRYELRLKENVT